MSDKKKLKFKLDLKSNSSGLENLRSAVDQSDLSKRIDELESGVVNLIEGNDLICGKAEELLSQMSEVNVNIHPLKPNVLIHWREQLGALIQDMKNNVSDMSIEEVEDEAVEAVG